MAVNNSGNAHLHLRTLFNVGAMGASSDGQLLERFVTGRGEPRELAFAALVERHGPFVLRVCRSVLRDEGAADDAFQATFLALARKAGSLWARDSLAPWLHQAAYRAAVHDRSVSTRRRSHERAAAALRTESVAPPAHANDGDLEKIIHEEIDRLPGRFRVAVVLCDLEGRTHEQAARHLGCAVGTVKSRLARGRSKLRGRLVRRGVAAPAPAILAGFVAGAARAAVPTALAETTVVYAATAGAVPSSITVITEGVLKSMLLCKVKSVITAAAVVALLAAGAVGLAQTGINKPLDRPGNAQHAGSSGWTYHISVSRDGEPPRKVAAVEMTGDTPIRVDAPGALILIQPKRDGEPEGKAAAITESDQKRRKIVLTSPKTMDVNLIQQYACQIHSWRHIDVRALEKGYLNEINVKTGQVVKKGDRLFKIAPILSNGTPGPQSVDVNAPFDGLIGRFQAQQDSLIREGDSLTTLSDNSMVWVYFNVPEKQYLDYIARRGKPEEARIHLVLANGKKFPQPGKIAAIEAEFNPQSGSIAFRADFPNPDGLLRHGQTGNIVMERQVRDALVIPMRATLETRDKRYVYVVDKGDVVHRREIVAQHEMDDIFVIEKGVVSVSDRIVLEGIRQVRNGEKVEAEFRSFDEVMKKSSNHSE